MKNGKNRSVAVAAPFAAIDNKESKQSRARQQAVRWEFFNKLLGTRPLRYAGRYAAIFRAATHKKGTGAEASLTDRLTTLGANELAKKALCHEDEIRIDNEGNVCGQPQGQDKTCLVVSSIKRVRR